MICMNLKTIEAMIRVVPDWPKPGISFKDITPILKDGRAFRFVIDKLARRFAKDDIDIVASAESRGFILGSTLAYKLGAGFVPLRKPGKLPWKTLREEYELEYGKDAFEVHQDGICPGDSVLIVDDVLATGGTMTAAIKLVERLGGVIAGVALLIELQPLGGRRKIVEDTGLQENKIYSLLKLD